MQPNDDSALLRQFIEQQSEEAFAALVNRYINLVYSVALRQTGRPQDAEEITQAVFIILARKAASLRSEKALSSWLFQTTRLTANNLIRSEIRRQNREQEAFMQSALTEPENDSWQQIAPLLDQAVAALREKDRRAILLRFYEGRNLRDVGNALGMSEDAAQKRVDRALEKLQVFFALRGVASTTAAIGETISTNSIQFAPAALAKSVTVVAIAKGASASASTLTLINGALKIMAWTKAKTAIVVSACVLLTAGTTTLALYDMGKPMRTVESDWSAISGDNGQWAFADGHIEAHSINGDSILASSEKYGDVTFSAFVKATSREASLAFRMQDASNGYILNFTPVGSQGEPNGFVRIRKRVANDETTLAVYQGPRLAATGKTAKIEVVAKGPFIEVFLNGANVLRVHDATFTNGYIGLRVYGWEDNPCDATFSGLTFR